MQNPKYNKLIATLQEIFMLDHAELDFGIYRIMNQKRNDIEQFLQKELIPQVKNILTANVENEVKAKQTELENKIKSVLADDEDPDTNKKVIALRADIEQAATNLDNEENDVFSALTKFFSRYYEGGDFVSKRRYKNEATYVVPYNGEEVKLHWANADQYYIKTSEFFRKYQFKTRGGNVKTIIFELLEVETEQNNNKTAADKARRFVFDENTPFQIEDDTLRIFFNYLPLDKSSKQAELNKNAYEKIKNAAPLDFAEKFLVLANPDVPSDKRTLLEKHLTDYTARNSFDYFIHKDLGKFLSHELGFFIKNEVLLLDDIAISDDKTFVRQLSKVRAIKNIATKIITFLAQLENFQKRLWLKKKFVTDTQYCLTLDRVPQDFYPEIAQNQAQIKAWCDLFSIHEIKTQTASDLLSADIVGFEECWNIEKDDKGNITVSFPFGEGRDGVFLLQNKFLVLDTQFFSSDFKNRLIATIENLDDTLDGLLLHSENFQALNLLQDRYHEQVKCVYIDPPYNTDASAIIYKNDYKKSSFMSLMSDRLNLGKELLTETGILGIAIDDEEVSELNILGIQIFEKEIGTLVVRSNPAGRKTRGKFAPSHEYALFYGKTDAAIPHSLELTEKRLDRYPQQDENGRFAWANFIRSGTGDKREDRPTMYYPLFVSDKNEIRIPKMQWKNEINGYEILELPLTNEKAVYPIVKGENGIIEKRWQRGFERVAKEVEEYRIRRNEKDDISIDFKTRMDENSLPTTWWDKNEYASSNHGALELKNLLTVKNFDFPKALGLVSDCIRTSGAIEQNSITLDYFAGSGTTGHAVINLNREDGGKRKYILCEMGEYFDTVTKPRIMKVIYSPDWKGGKPVAHGKGSSHGFKYLRLESYEDTLNNLVLQQNATQTLALQQDARFREGYMLGYMLDVESRESLLNVSWFRKPFDCYLHITRQNESRESKIDLVETFNYLIGLVIEQQYSPKAGFFIVKGRTLQGEKTLVIWRDLETTDNTMLEQLMQRNDFNPRDQEFSSIYVNGDHHLDNLRADDERWKVTMIEEEFKKRMS